MRIRCWFIVFDKGRMITQMIRAVIVEDQLDGLNNLKNILKANCPEVKVVATANSVAEAIKMFKKPDLQPNVAFLDIHLQDGLIFEALNQLPQVNFEIIFVTAFETCQGALYVWQRKRTLIYYIVMNSTVHRTCHACHIREVIVGLTKHHNN